MPTITENIANVSFDALFYGNFRYFVLFLALFSVIELYGALWSAVYRWLTDFSGTTCTIPDNSASGEVGIYRFLSLNNGKFPCPALPLVLFYTLLSIFFYICRHLALNHVIR